MFTKVATFNSTPEGPIKTFSVAMLNCSSWRTDSLTEFVKMTLEWMIKHKVHPYTIKENNRTARLLFIDSKRKSLAKQSVWGNKTILRKLVSVDGGFVSRDSIIVIGIQHPDMMVEGIGNLFMHGADGCEATERIKVDLVNGLFLALEAGGWRYVADASNLGASLPLLGDRKPVKKLSKDIRALIGLVKARRRLAKAGKAAWQGSFYAARCSTHARAAEVLIEAAGLENGGISISAEELATGMREHRERIEALMDALTNEIEKQAGGG